MGSIFCEFMLKRVLVSFCKSYIAIVAIVIGILGVTLGLLLLSVLSMISRINLLVRQLDSILEIFKESEAKMESAARSVMGDLSETGASR